MRFALVILILAAMCVSAAASDLVPTVPDSGFENNAAGWGWQTYSGAQAFYEVSTVNPHSGKHCVVFSSNFDTSPNVYGRLATGVNVLPSTKYELNCWVRGEDVKDSAGSSHITDWLTYTLTLPTGTFGWKKISTTFTTNPGQNGITIGINVSGRCKALAIDDIELRPLGGQLQGDGITGIILATPRVVGHDATAQLCVVLENSSTKAVAVESAVSIDGRRVAKNRSRITAGENKIDWKWNTGKNPFGKYEYQVRVVADDGDILASGGASTEVADSPLFAELDKVAARRAEFDALYKQCAAKKIDLSYPTAAKTMLDQFMPLAREDARMGFEYRTKWAVDDFNRSLDDAIAEMKAYLADPSLAPTTKRYKTGKVTIDGLDFVGSRVDSTGKMDQGPLFFCGYGHFSQARTDMPRWPGYGVNIIQAAEFGPAMVFPKEDVVDLTLVKTLIKTLDAAAKNNVRVDWLLSPHFFPAWALQKYPQLGKGSGGFFSFCVDDPAAKAIVEKFIRIVIPMIKDKPALHSICLTNEPVFNNIANCDNTRQIWLDYLARTHGDIATLNERYGTRYASFADVPYTGDPQTYDWIVCDQQRFAAWHKWMADIIHEMAPNIPTHAKVMSTQLSTGGVFFAADQELLGNYLEINGNDCYEFPTGNKDWPLDNWPLSLSYDMQRSLAHKPVFNSENHIAPDGSTYYIAPSHFRMALWQGAIHGEGSTTIWVWERTFDPGYCFIGSVMERPGCAQAVGTTCLDLNRFADEVSALKNVKAPVAVVYSNSAMIRYGDKHGAAVMRAYQSLGFCGIKIDFISEKQLAAGKGADYKIIVVPEAETITDSAFEGIGKLPASTRVVLLSECFTRNEYGEKRSPEAIKAVQDKAFIPKDGDPGNVLWPMMRKELDAVGASPEFSVVDAKTGEPIWGVEWLPAKVNGRTVINMINFQGKPVEVKILRDGKEVEAKDLLSLGGRERVATLKSLTPVLAEIR